MWARADGANPSFAVAYARSEWALESSLDFAISPFRSRGWGHFTTMLGTASLATVTSLTLSVAPASVTAPVGVFMDPTATDEKSRVLTSLCSFLGGRGPFIARIWISRSNIAGEPIELVDDPSVFRAAITQEGMIGSGKAYDLTRKDEKVLGKRTWILYETKIDAQLPATAFFTMVFGRSGGAFMATAPEVVALNLMPPADTAMSLELPAKVRALTTDERAAMDFYVRQPHPLGLPQPTSTKVSID